jgi:hypothetical protein
MMAGGFRWLSLLAIATVLLMMIGYRQAFERATYSMRMVLSSTLILMAAFAGLNMAAFAGLNMAGCGGGSAVVTSPPIITPAGTSTIVITPTALSSTGQPLQLQPIQLTLSVN